ncbi:MAG: hypothetical protein RQ729_05030, partial [Wenzhouxiangellaceae bacterium]|nr:hypothetical protein [Wenzhouxiangellaceae bacterium]
MNSVPSLIPHPSSNPLPKPDDDGPLASILRRVFEQQRDLHTLADAIRGEMEGSVAQVAESSDRIDEIADRMQAAIHN